MIRHLRTVLVALTAVVGWMPMAGAQHLMPQDGASAAGAAPSALAAVNPLAGMFAPRGLVAPKNSSAGPVAPPVFVAPLVYLCDNAGRLGTLNLDTGRVTVIGRMGVVLTDIGFAPNGILYGVTFNRFYRINAATAAVTPIGPGLGVAGINALTFNKAGQALAASTSVRGFYTINRTTGRASYAGDNGPFTSAGDFAYDGVHLYFAAEGRRLVDYNFSTNRFVSRPVTLVNLFGLVVPQPGTLVGFAGTRAYRLNRATGASTELVNFTNKGLSLINGAASRRLF